MPDNRFPLPGCTLCLGTAPAVVTSLLLLDAPLSLAVPLLLWRPVLDWLRLAAGDAEDVLLLLAGVGWSGSQEVPVPLGMLLLPREKALLLKGVPVTVRVGGELLELLGGLLGVRVAGVLAVAAEGLAARGWVLGVRGLTEGVLAGAEVGAPPLEGVVDEGLLLVLGCWY